MIVERGGVGFHEWYNYLFFLTNSHILYPTLAVASIFELEEKLIKIPLTFPDFGKDCLHLRDTVDLATL